MRFLGWVDHDPEQQQSVLHGLAVSGRDARDELGLGTIRDTLSDLLFPGTSTVQQRVRYFLFVQWCCEIAARRPVADGILDHLRRLEAELIRTLTPLGEGEGVIGILSQEELERMPSEIYWNGLRALGMRRVAGTRDRWARQIALDKIASTSDPWAERASAASTNGFDPGRPAPPQGFPACEGLDFGLQPEEAEYLRHRLSEASVDAEGHGREYSLFPEFLEYRGETRAATAWQHPRVGRLREPARGLLAFAAALSHVMHGATHLYNARVAELSLKHGARQDTWDRHVGLLQEWRRKLEPEDVFLVLARIGELPALGPIVRHRVREQTTEFVRGWAEHCRRPGDLLTRVAAVQLVERREVLLKGGNVTDPLQ